MKPLLGRRRGRERQAALRLLALCTRCFCVWFPAKKGQPCPEGPHGATLLQPLLAKCCDLDISLDEIQDHLQTADPVHPHATWLRRRRERNAMSNLTAAGTPTIARRGDK
jgi:hypothetical protein